MIPSFSFSFLYCLAPVIGYLVSGPNVSTQDAILYWSEYMYSKATANTGGSAAIFNANATATTALEAESPPDTGPVISVYSPEIQALLAYE